MSAKDYRVARSWRYGLVNADVILQNDIPPLARYVYAVLTTYANADRTAWPTRATIAAAAGVSETTVRLALDSLEGAGVIARTRRAAVSGRTITTLITLTDTPGREVAPHAIPPGGGGATRHLGGGATRPHDTSPERGEVAPDAGEVAPHATSEVAPHAPITEPLEQDCAREEILNLRDPIAARCRHCGIEHLTDEPCTDAGRRLAATRARGMLAVRTALTDRGEVPP